MIFCLGTSVACAQITNGLKEGYRGFVDIGYSNCYDESAFTASTTHGWQLNRFVFLGGGAGVNTSGLFPVYADVKVTFLDRRWTPFVETRAGVGICDDTGGYMSTVAGARLRLNGRYALNLMAGYERLDEGGTMFQDDVSTDAGFVARVGIEF